MLIIFVFPLNIVTYKNMQTLCGFLDRKVLVFHGLCL